MGKIPKRPKGVIPFIPLEGHHGKHEYLGYLNIKRTLIHIIQKKGFIVSANYYPEVDFGFNHFGNWQPEERYARLNNLFSKKEKWSVDEIKSVFLDDYVGGKEKIVPIIQSVLSESVMDESIRLILKNWDGHCIYR